MARPNSALVSFLLSALLLSAAAPLDAQPLSPDFYDSSCPLALTIIKAGIFAAVLEDPRNGASLLRAHFHDCFVQGCDGSVLLDDTPTFTGEKTAPPNNNSLRALDVIDDIKYVLELTCPRTVSCADILTVAARDSVAALGGPRWDVPLGRRDSTTASFSLASTNLPPPFGNLDTLIQLFANQGLSTTDMVALSGAHTIGLAHCGAFRTRIYNDNNIDPVYASSLKQGCPDDRSGDRNLFPMDPPSPEDFDNSYYNDLLQSRGLFHSDQELYNNGAADAITRSYAANQNKFFQDFASAMIKMGNIKPLTGTAGEIRVNCRKVNQYAHAASM